MALVFCFSAGALGACRDTTAFDPDGGQADSGRLPGDPDADPGDRADAGPPPLHVPPTAAGIAYFSSISDSLSNQSLVSALHGKLAGDHVELSYESLYNIYATTDGNRDGCTGIFDFYSNKCWAPAEKCGNYSREGDCFNREHSWPKSWWGGQMGPDQHQDLISVIPADGYVNNKRGQLPLGLVANPTYTSTNGSKIGNCSSLGIVPTEKCFEPTDELKGDMARIYFYQAVRYEGEFGCCEEPSVNRSDIKAWEEAQLRVWHVQDPVDTWERDRNESVFDYQKNRNPFVDFPVFVDRISDF